MNDRRTFVQTVLVHIGLIVLMCLAIALFPQLVTWLPETLYSK